MSYPGNAKKLAARFGPALLEWNRVDNQRQMPWKGEKDPYKIWLSEVILQQTRVDQGLKYYENFIAAFPKVSDLANAPAEAVFKLWEGLGYYSRCRNLIASAQYIQNVLGGKFPADYEGILSLKGVGPYTAAAIASFAYNLPYAVLDGNVFRVLSRIYDNDTPVDSTEGKKLFSQLAADCLVKEEPASYNQAIMDFGATICKPVPDCASCFFQKQCFAFAGGRQDLLPVKSKKTQVRERWFYYFIVQYGAEVLVHQRAEKDIWQDLYEFILIETKGQADEAFVLSAFKKQYLPEAGRIEARWDLGRQKLSHQTIHFTIYLIKPEHKTALPGMIWKRKKDLANIAFPRSLSGFVSQYMS